MKKTGFEIASTDCALVNSLAAIKNAQSELQLLTSIRESPTLLASQIELYDLLLDEISIIRGNLARHLQQAHQITSA